MSILEQQADDYVSGHIMQWIGALRTYGQRMNFFLSVPNTLMIGVLFYNDAPVLHAVFPTVYHWIGFILLVVVPAAILVDRVLLHPAQIMYNSHQSGRENRSPNYRETMENQRQIQDLHARLDQHGVPRGDEE